MSWVQTGELDLESAAGLQNFRKRANAFCDFWGTLKQKVRRFLYVLAVREGTAHLSEANLVKP